ncbi:hypothetical protein [Agromyces binzhouensis]|uniref:DUF7882 domain-containing protein n=1 Tax=Agromyces binzhouensis TaxID=1817495 RepID=A0A4Q2JIF3_9MICO|nr:hypothetical protein [Agromyces binzhouensis]RXZ46296.1 hypothetical protein ESO86_10650 [Agromyces binzhouensis]
MGTLHVGRITRIDLPDIVLAHVHAVVIAKLRIHEPVLVGWISPEGHRDEVLVHPTMPVVVNYDADDRIGLVRDWLERLMRSANGVGGLQLTPEAIEELAAIGGTRVDAGAPAPAS